jgi:hypothetical protein
MSRDVTNAFIQACNAQQTSEGIVILVTITDDESDKPIYLNNSGQNFKSRGNTYLACPIQATLSEDMDDRPPQAKLVMDNIDGHLIAIIRSITTPPTIMLEVVRFTEPDIVEMQLSDFQMKEINYNNLTIEGTLTLEGLFQEPAVMYNFTPSYFPGLFVFFLLILEGVNRCLV